MRFPRTTKLVVATALAITTLPAMAAAAPGTAAPAGPGPLAQPVPVVPPGDPVLSEELPTPEEALDAVQEAFEEPEGTKPELLEELAEDGRDLTLRLRDLHRQYDDLSGRERSLADVYLARPTDGRSDPDSAGYAAEADPTTSCTTDPHPDICITYARATSDAPPAVDEDDNGLPDQVDDTRRALLNVWKRIVTEGGYAPPKRDGGPSKDQGPTTGFDVYLTDLDGLYGFCNIDEYSVNTGRDLPGYCVLDDDYSAAEFGTVNTPLENLQVTAAHEFFHAVQFAYDFDEDGWFMEGTAAWMEDEIYDDVNDNLQYLYRQSPITSPGKPLDFFGDGFAYGSWVWWRFVTERFPATAGTGLPVIMRDTWEAAHHRSPSDHGTYSLKAIARTITDRDRKITRVFADFGEAIRHPGRGDAFEEGSAYPKARPVDSYKLSRTRRGSRWQTAKMPHLTNWTMAFIPRSGLRAKKWKLRIDVNSPKRSRGSFSQLTIYHDDKTISTQVVRLDRRGDGRAKVPFSSRAVDRVELTITNAGRRFRCNQGSYLSCKGSSRDNGLETDFRARAIR